MEEAKFFSADSHVNEPPEAWERIPKQLREHGPHFVQDPPGKKGLYMVFDGHEPDPVGMTFTAGQDKAGGNFRKIIETFKWEDWRGPWDPAARIGGHGFGRRQDGSSLSEHGAEFLQPQRR